MQPTKPALSATEAAPLAAAAAATTATAATASNTTNTTNTTSNTTNTTSNTTNTTNAMTGPAPLIPAPQHPSPPEHARTQRRILWALLVAYSLTLATIALWPTHVDAPASAFLAQLTRALPWLTYARIEFTANILLFVPFGVLLSLLLRPRRARWWRAIATAAAFSITAELLQLLASDRTSSVADVVANTSGAALGILIVALARRATGKPQGRPIP